MAEKISRNNACPAREVIATIKGYHRVIRVSLELHLNEMSKSRQHGVAVLCTFCLFICSGSFGNIEDISHQEVSFNQAYKENLVSETI